MKDTQKVGRSQWVTNRDKIVSVYDRVGECWQKIGGYLNGAGHSEMWEVRSTIVPSIVQHG